jgi:queuine tRNA-ribosyltransferase
LAILVIVTSALSDKAQHINFYPPRIQKNGYFCYYYYMNHFKFEIIHQSKKSKARVGIIHTPHGPIMTPCFVPVGTNAAIKALDSVNIADFDLPLIFCNTYHLLIQPGTKLVQQAGGLHNFMQRTKPIITDSGGFQVFSLAYGGVHDELKSRGTKKLNNTVLAINEEGVLFRSYKDGTPIFLTPESSIQAQKELGADIILPLDELPPYHTNKQQLQTAFERTHRWQERSLNEHKKDPKNQTIYAIVHGGIDPELRKQSALHLRSHAFDGYAIGGSFGKNYTDMVHMLNGLMPHIPSEAPRHLLGMGETRSIESIITLGIDTFDSSYPTRCARHGLFFTTTSPVKILNSRYKNQLTPVDATCMCYTCQHYSAAYLQHLFKAHELSAYTLATIHNLHVMAKLMQYYRQQINADAL